jgi:hypothetical protein
MLGKVLQFDCMNENKIFFFCFLKGEINLKYLRFFLNFFLKVLEETRYFNTGSVFYNVSIQPNIKQN